MVRMIKAAFMAVLCVTATLAGCADHEHAAGEPAAHSPQGGYTCPKHGGSYGSARDHCSVCGDHVKPK
jgi:hypothetical protein